MSSSAHIVSLASLGVTTIAWRSQPLGVDGVIVERVHDPPGGWRPFRVSLATGELVDGQT